MNFIFRKNKYRQIKAFTLLETLASMSIIAAVILGPLTVAVNSSSYARQTKDIMTVTYLAEEAIELLHNQYDSLYLACLNTVAPCGVGVPNSNETTGETAWRLFKTRIINNSQSCSLPNGCAFDFRDMSDSMTTDPTKYSTTGGSDCQSLSLMSAPMTVNNVLQDTLRRFYVCSGVASHKIGATLTLNPNYSRKVIVVSLPTFEMSPPYYHDDLRITSRVTFKRSNGVSRDIDVIDFLHARP